MSSVTRHPSPVTIIGGGLAGCEAAWQLARRRIPVRLFEMKPHRYSPAHQQPELGELVCSNSLRSDDTHSAVGLLKEEMRRLDSLIMTAADATRVPAGGALAVDRHRFARFLTDKLAALPLVEIVREEVTALPPAAHGPTILATGPLSSDAITASLVQLTGQQNLAFYDAIAPIVDADSLDRTIIYQASRYDHGPGDYLNCPMDREQYLRFTAALAAADKVPLKEFEDPAYFEGCLPIEVMLERGVDTPRFGPMKPVGLPDPRTGRDPYAVVQLRREDQDGSCYNMVGFQTKMTYGAQRQVFRLIPGLERVEFLRLGSIHRNTFVCAPRLLTPTLQCRNRTDLILAGQLSGVEGYVESASMGLWAGLVAAALVRQQPITPPPPETALGAQLHHLIATEADRFQPSNVNFGLFPPLPRKMKKRDRGAFRSKLALERLTGWQASLPI